VRLDSRRFFIMFDKSAIVQPRHEWHASYGPSMFPERWNFVDLGKSSSLGSQKDEGSPMMTQVNSVQAGSNSGDMVRNLSSFFRPPVSSTFSIKEWYQKRVEELSIITDELKMPLNGP
jgi:hypothetical protein